MRGLPKSKRVSWASDVNLCQVRLFLSEDSPSQVGLDSQDHLQAKTSWPLHSSGTGSDDILPPGFEGAHPANQLQTKLSQIPQVKWIRPSRIVLNIAWQVVAGEDSKEVETQKQREMRVLEAVYPRPSAIPPNPSILADAEASHYDDEQTLSIPITPIEDEDAVADTLSISVAPSSQSFQQSPGIPSLSQHGVLNLANPLATERPSAGMVVGTEPDVAAAASAAYTAIMSSNDQGNLIDQELLIKILSNPKMIERLVTDYGAAATQSMPISRAPPVALPDPPPAHINRTQSSTPLSGALPTGPLYPQPNGAGMGPLPNPRLPPPPGIPISSQPSVGAPPAKDINYYKSLIQQHGGDRQEALPQYGNRHHSHQSVTNQESVNSYKSRDSKPKIMKPCMYFNTPRGCRHGANCAYQHDTSFQQRGSPLPDVPSAKRMKMDREISS
ncbi:zinc finger CCCH domain-containing protein 6 [Ziziphus jujuba]|uniref:Zinc finger CCCH domain-containing protein 6 n=1 Tax=Ziziphus jujuba TaxID=326968 RepID=A0A6P3ZTY2_ZIZJJ|nr:zinc finger CCCH domain-containing protein 6 [Ziziphus jujuba]